MNRRAPARVSPGMNDENSTPWYPLRTKFGVWLVQPHMVERTQWRPGGWVFWAVDAWTRRQEQLPVEARLVRVVISVEVSQVLAVSRARFEDRPAGRFIPATSSRGQAACSFARRWVEERLDDCPGCHGSEECPVHSDLEYLGR